MVVSAVLSKSGTVPKKVFFLFVKHAVSFGI